MDGTIARKVGRMQQSKASLLANSLPICPRVVPGAILDHLRNVQLPSTEPKQPNRALNAALIPVAVAVVLWSIWLLDHTYAWGLARFGILPRTVTGLVGVGTGPLLHGDLNHLFNNSTALLMLGWCLMYFYPRVAGKVVLLGWLVGGFGVWLTGRGNIHIGASGIIYGMAAFLFVSGMLRKQRTLMALALLVVFLYGGLIWGILPLVERLSWEGHFWGAAGGIIAAVWYKHVPPAISDPKPAFLEEDDEEEALAGNADVLTIEGAAPPVPPSGPLSPEPAPKPGNISTTWDR